MSLRKKALEQLSIKYPYEKNVKKLTQEELKIIDSFILEHDDLGHLDFEYKVNRMFLIQPKTKNWTFVMDLLVSANSRVHFKGRA